MNLFEKHPRPWRFADILERYLMVDDADGRSVFEIEYAPGTRSLKTRIAEFVLAAINAYQPDANPAPAEFRPWSVQLNQACHYEVIRGDGTVFGKDAVRAACVSVVRAVNESHGYDEHGQPINPVSTNHERAPDATVSAEEFHALAARLHAVNNKLALAAFGHHAAACDAKVQTIRAIADTLLESIGVFGEEEDDDGQ